MDAAPVLKKYGLDGRPYILGVASIWMKEKGLEDFAALLRHSRACPGNLTVVLVGKMTPEQQAALPEGVVAIPRTSDARELAALYSGAEVFVNPTWQDNYPTVNLEAIACGTPVITYRTGGSPEALGKIPGTSPGMTEGTKPGMRIGAVVEKGDVEAVLRHIRAFMAGDRAEISKSCRKFAVENFNKADRYKDYIGLYDDMMQ